MFALCTNCANLLPAGATTCPRCGQSTLSLSVETKLDSPAEQALVCGAGFHYFREGDKVCRCGKYGEI